MSKLKKVLMVLLITLILAFSALPAFANETTDDARYGKSVINKMNNPEGILFAYEKIAEGLSDRIDVISLEGAPSKLTSDEINDAYMLVHNDYPEFFWVKSSYSSMLDSNTNETVSISPVYTVSASDLPSFKKSFDEKAVTLTKDLSGKSDYEKALILHDRVASTVSYVSTSNDQNAYGALVEGKAVCAGYSKAYQLLLGKVGVSAWSVIGKSINPATKSLENHEWNLVKLDSLYYYTDVTWDDQGKNLFHTYLNMSESQLKEKHTVTHFADLLPTANSDKHNYFAKNNLIFEKFDATAIAKALKSHNNDIHIFVKNNPEDFQSEIKNKISDIVSALNAPSGSGYSYALARLDHEIVLNVKITPSNHKHALTFHPAVTADCATVGNIDYYSCECGQFFSDENAKQPIEDSNSVFIDLLPHEAGEWHSNEELHWKLCNKCNGLIEETKSEHQGERKCEICGRLNSPFGAINENTVYMILGGAAGIAILAVLITVIAVSSKKRTK